MLAIYWAVRYFVPAGLSLWMAKQARKHWDSVSAVVVMAASYAASMAVSHRLLAGSTSTIKLHYPLFSGYVTIPRVVAKWIRHQNGLAKLLTKTVSTTRSCLKVNQACVFTLSMSLKALHNSYLIQFGRLAVGFWSLGLAVTGCSTATGCLAGYQRTP